jgi:hypothetical protein
VLLRLAKEELRMHNNSACCCSICRPDLNNWKSASGNGNIGSDSGNNNASGCGSSKICR